ncbi:hypothetical protein TRVA0_017S00232 [Trichomonascus vanleenenianus]|uniref:palmitoyltransferase SWF1 n=1 Tax=Trichomonascus vanleenenianus TaxID=2268995 RepID=UPI003ECB359F
MNFLLKAALVVALVCILLIIILFGELPQFQGTILARLRSKLFSVPGYVKKLDDRVSGGRLSAVSSQAWLRLEPLARWAVPVGYTALVTGCLVVFFSAVYPQLVSEDERHISTFQSSVLIPIIATMPYVSTVLAVFSNPGRITRVNHHRMLKHFPYDSILFLPNMECSTCKRKKPARSKHCSTCNACIAMCDHHCVWINNCVGYYNYRWFLLFVACNCVLLSYGFYLSRKALKLTVVKLISDGIVANPGIGNYKAWSKAIVKSSTHRKMGSLMILTALLFPVAFAFLLEHIKYIYLGVTTNETLKWEDLTDSMHDGTLWFYDHDTPEARQMSHAKNEPSIVLQKFEGENHFNRRLTPYEEQRVQSHRLILKKLDNLHHINNIYDLGFWRNLRDRLLPPPM